MEKKLMLSPCPSEYRLDRLHTEELEPGEACQLRSHIATCGECQHRLEIRRDEGEALQRHPGFEALLQRGLLLAQEGGEALFAKEPTNATSQRANADTQEGGEALFGQEGGKLPRAEGQPFSQEAPGNFSREKAKETSFRPEEESFSRPEEGRSWWATFGGRGGGSWGGFSAASLAAAAALILFLLPQPQEGEKNRPPGGLLAPAKSQSSPAQTAKSNAPVLQMLHYYQGNRHSQRTRNGQPLHPGDLIQFVYRLPQKTHLMILSLNKRGEISVFVPLGGRKSLMLKAGEGTLPPRSSLELDDYVGEERIFIVTSKGPFGVAAVRRSLRRVFRKKGRKLEGLTTFPGPWRIKTILIRKQKKQQTGAAPSESK